jgi:hypothetical protein
MDALLELDDLIDDEADLEVGPPPGEASPVAPPAPRHAAPPPSAAPRSGGADGAPPPQQPSRASEGWAFQPVSQQRASGGGFGASAGGSGATRPQNVSERAASVAAEAARPDMTVEKFSGMRIRCAAARCAQLHSCVRSRCVF